MQKCKEEKFFVYLGNLESPKSIGTNKLIQKGAKLVTNVQDIICEYTNLKFDVSKKETIVNKEYEHIFNILNIEPLSLDEIAKKLKLDISEVIYKTTILEIEEKIKRVYGDKFIKM